jgi:putative flippase GtrA
VGFALINGFTFGVDIAMLSRFRGLLGWPVWLAITASYLIAFGLSFVLNRWLNFRLFCRFRGSLA